MNASRMWFPTANSFTGVCWPKQSSSFWSHDWKLLVFPRTVLAIPHQQYALTLKQNHIFLVSAQHWYKTVCITVVIIRAMLLPWHTCISYLYLYCKTLDWMKCEQHQSVSTTMTAEVILYRSNRLHCVLVLGLPCTSIEVEDYLVFQGLSRPDFRIFIFWIRIECIGGSELNLWISVTSLAATIHASSLLDGICTQFSTISLFSLFLSNFFVMKIGLSEFSLKNVKFVHTNSTSFLIKKLLEIKK